MKRLAATVNGVARPGLLGDGSRVEPGQVAGAWGPLHVEDDGAMQDGVG